MIKHDSLNILKYDFLMLHPKQNFTLIFLSLIEEKKRNIFPSRHLPRMSQLCRVAVTSSTTVVVRNTFIDEISPLGSSTHSKYVTKKISLATPATSMKIRLAANVPSKSNVLVYYRTSPVGTKDAYSTIDYVLASPDTPITKVGFGDTTMSDVEYTLNGLTAFDSFTVKIVMQSTNSSEVPTVKDLRVVACS
jgi:hypothetical protein